MSERRSPHPLATARSVLFSVVALRWPVVRLSTIIILVGLVRFTPLPPPLGIVLGATLILTGIVVRVFTDK